MFFSRRGPKLSHLFFVDDLILFCDVDKGQTTHINDILNMFCHFSGQKVNRSKTRVLFSPNTPDELATKFVVMLGLHEWLTFVCILDCLCYTKEWRRTPSNLWLIMFSINSIGRKQESFQWWAKSH